MGRLVKRLWQSGVSREKRIHIMTARKLIRKPMLRGLPEKTIEHVLHDFPQYTWKGTLNTSNVADLRALHLTRRRRNFKYAFEDRDLVTREASKVLREQRDSIKARCTERFIQLPKGKHDPAVGRPRTVRQKAQHKHQPTNLSCYANVDDIDEEDDEAMQAYYRYLCETFDDDPSKTVFDEEFTHSSIGEPEDAPTSGEPTSDLVSTEEDGRKMKRKLESAFSTTNDLSDHADHDLKRRKMEIEVPDSSNEGPDDYDIEMDKAIKEILSQDSHEQEECTGELTSDLVSTEEVGRGTKRKLESAFSLEATTNDLSDQVDHNLKRRKLEEEVPGSSMEEPDDYDAEMAKAIKEILSQDLHEQEQCTSELISKPVNTLEIGKQAKRKRESTSSLEPHTEDLIDHVDRDLKRRKREIDALELEPADRGALLKATGSSDEGIGSGLRRQATVDSCTPAHNQSQQPFQDRYVVDD